jgi:exoribonuclease R
MAVNVFSASVPIDEARAGLDRVRADHDVVLEFPEEVLAEAEAAIAAYVLPATDRTDLGFVTLDPASSTDLDQAFYIERAGAGFRVLYAIADVPAFVAMGGAIDVETRRRGETVYFPDLKVSLHPPRGLSVRPSGAAPSSGMGGSGSGSTRDLRTRRWRCCARSGSCASIRRPTGVR